MLNKKFLFCLILGIFILAMTSVSATDLNESNADLTMADDVPCVNLNGRGNSLLVNDNILSSNVADKTDVNLTAPAVEKFFNGDERFNVFLKDDKNKPIKNENVSIFINNIYYTRTTNDNGIASMALNLNSAEYPVVVKYNGNSLYNPANVTSNVLIKSTINGSDITKIYRNGTQYYATFKDSKGAYLPSKSTVNFNINGVFYERQIEGNKGLAKLNINLNPKGYIITAMNPYSNEQLSNKITVLPSIVENRDLTKYYKNASRYTLRILGDNGKPVGEGVEVKLNINGIYYTRTTNASGYINMNINLPPETYTVTAEYNGLMASNKITILSVLETHDLSMKYKDGSQFETKVLDGQGKPYAGQNVTFNINGVFYTKPTEADGIARLTINLPAGEYIITSTFNGLNAANKVTVNENKPEPTPDPDKTLQQLVDESTGTLKITKDYSNEGDITVNKNLIINGNGHTFSKIRFINDNHDLTFINSNFKDNYYEGNGGVIYSSGNVNIINSTFMKNTIQETGAGVAIYSLGNIDIKDSYFTSNNFIIRAGTDHNKDGAITYSAGNTNIANTIFEENSGHNYNIIQGKYLQIHESIFSKNSARWITGYEGAEITNSIFNHEGAVLSYLYSYIVNNCSFIDYGDDTKCLYILANCSNCNFTNISWLGIAGNHSNCNFINSSKLELGIFFKNKNYVELSDCNIVNGKIESYGLYSASNCSFVNISNDQIVSVIEGGKLSGCSFVNCTSANGFSLWGDSCVSGCDFVNCTTTTALIKLLDNGYISDCSFVNCTSANELIRYFDDGYISDCSFVNCTTTNTLIGNVYDNVFNISGCSFVNCSNIEGNTIHLGEGYVSGCSFVNCSTVNGNGGAIYITGGHISDSIFVNCSTVNGNGGAIYINQTDPNTLITNCTFINNYPNDIAFNKLFSVVKIIGNTTYLETDSPVFSFEIVDESGNIYNDAIGMLYINIDNEYYGLPVELKNGKGSITLYQMNPGTYNLRVKYDGDEKHYSSENSFVFKVIQDT